MLAESKQNHMVFMLSYVAWAKRELGVQVGLLMGIRYKHAILIPISWDVTPLTTTSVMSFDNFSEWLDATPRPENICKWCQQFIKQESKNHPSTHLQEPLPFSNQRFLGLIHDHVQCLESMRAWVIRIKTSKWPCSCQMPASWRLSREARKSYAKAPLAALAPKQ